jgi:hypothetical protein
MKNIRRANRPIIDNQGLATGILKSISFGTGMKEEKKGRDIEEIEYEKCTFLFSVEGITGPIQMQLMTGTVINDIPPHIIAKGRGVKKEKPIYNRFTSACIALGIVEEKELPTINEKREYEIDESLKQIKDIRVNFKIVRQEKTGFLNIDPKTIQIIKE